MQELEAKQRSGPQKPRVGDSIKRRSHGTTVRINSWGSSASAMFSSTGSESCKRKRPYFGIMPWLLGAREFYRAIPYISAEQLPITRHQECRLSDMPRMCLWTQMRTFAAASGNMTRASRMKRARSLSQKLPPRTNRLNSKMMSPAMAALTE